MFWRLYSSNFETSDRVFKSLREILNRYSVELKDKTVLELGPGNTYINAYNFLLREAKKVVLVDKYPRHIKTTKERNRLNKEIEFVKHKINSSTRPFFITADGLPDRQYIQFIAGDINDISLPSIDIIISTSVLEHIREIEKSIKKMVTVLAPGGYMYHRIDMRDHYNFKKPFLFYKYSDKTWNSYLTKEGISYTNRWRYQDFIDSFRNNGLEIVWQAPIRFPLHIKNIDGRFADRDDLDIGGLRILLKKKHV